MKISYCFRYGYHDCLIQIGIKFDVYLSNLCRFFQINIKPFARLSEALRSPSIGLSRYRSRYTIYYERRFPFLLPRRCCNICLEGQVLIIVITDPRNIAIISQQHLLEFFDVIISNFSWAAIILRCQSGRCSYSLPAYSTCGHNTHRAKCNMRSTILQTGGE